MGIFTSCPAHRTQGFTAAPPISVVGRPPTGHVYFSTPGTGRESQTASWGLNGFAQLWFKA